MKSWIAISASVTEGEITGAYLSVQGSDQVPAAAFDYQILEIPLGLPEPMRGRASRKA